MRVRTRTVIIMEIEAAPSSAVQIQSEGGASSNSYALSNTALGLKVKIYCNDVN
jgi:hypothetical protein